MMITVYMGEPFQMTGYQQMEYYPFVPIWHNLGTLMNKINEFNSNCTNKYKYQWNTNTGIDADASKRKISLGYLNSKLA